MKLFYISPYSIDEDFSKKLTILQNACNQFGIELCRGVVVEGIFDLKETLKLFNQADVFIADLSFERPSCYFEVGYVQALNKNIFLIAKKNTVIHQLMNRENIKLYDSIESYQEVINELISSLLS